MIVKYIVLAKWISATLGKPLNFSINTRKACSVVALIWHLDWVWSAAHTDTWIACGTLMPKLQGASTQLADRAGMKARHCRPRSASGTGLVVVEVFLICGEVFCQQLDVFSIAVVC